MENIKDDRGYNQVWADTKSTRVRAERRCDYLISQMTLNGAKNVLEIGCGKGNNSFMLAQKTKMQILGTDLCVPFIEEAKKNFQLPHLRFKVLDFNQAAQFEGEKFDYIVGNGILHHLYYNLDTSFSKMRDLLRENGKIIFIEPNLYNPYVAAIFKNKKLRQLARLEPDEMAFSKSFIAKKLKTAEFTNIRVVYKDFLLPGIPSFLITPSIIVGDFLEKIPLRYISQSILISATV